MKKNKKTLSCLLLIITTLYSTIGEVVVKVSGEAKGEFFNNLGQLDPALSEYHHFEVITDFNGSWRIRLSQSDGKLTNSELDKYLPLEYTGGHEASSGTHVKYSLSEKKRTLENLPPMQGFSSADNFPSFLPYNARVLWFAYCSSSWLDSKSTGEKVITMPLLWKNEQYDLSGFGFKLEPEFLNSQPHLPASTSFIRDTSLDLSFEKELGRLFVTPPKDLESKNRLEKQYEKRLKFWPDSELAGVYKVTESNVHFGFEIPEAAELVAYQGNKEIILEQYPIENRPKLGEFFAKFEFHVATVEKLKSPPQSFLPPVDGLVGVQDTRFRKKGNSESFDTISYIISPDFNAPTNFWLSSTNPFLASLAGSQLEFNPIVDPTLKSWYRLALYVLLGLVLVAIPLLSFKNFRNTLKTKVNKIKK